MFKRVSISLIIMKEKEPIVFDLQNEIVLNYSFCLALASPNISPKTLNIFHGFNEALSTLRKTSYLNIYTLL